MREVKRLDDKALLVELHLLLIDRLTFFRNLFAGRELAMREEHAAFKPSKSQTCDYFVLQNWLRRGTAMASRVRKHCVRFAWLILSACPSPVMFQDLRRQGAKRFVFLIFFFSGSCQFGVTQHSPSSTNHFSSDCASFSVRITHWKRRL